jgi:protein-disulfide isomerase
MQRKSLVSILAVAGGALVLVVALVLANRTTSSNASPKSSNLQMVDSINEMLSGIPQKGIALGNPKAKLTLVEFADLQCSACAYFSENALPELIQNYVRTGKVRIELRGQTFVDSFQKGAQDSKRLLRMALAAGQQNKLWNFVEIVYANQGAEDTGYATDSYLKAVASAVPGLKVAKALSARQAKQLTSAIRASGSRFEASHFNSTPSFLLGPTGKKPAKKVTGNVPSYKKLATLITALLRS